MDFILLKNTKLYCMSAASLKLKSVPLDSKAGTRLRSNHV